MKKQVLLLTILTGLLHLQAVQGIKCWECDNYSEGAFWYDYRCGWPNYPGSDDHVDESDYPGSICYTHIYGEGNYMYRGLQFAEDQADGDCLEYMGDTYCYCTENFCNTGLCEHCFTTEATTKATITTTEATTTTTESATTTTKLSTSTIEPTTSTESLEGLRCYSCVGCTHVDASTPIIQDVSYRSCTTKVLFANAKVIRGASPEVHQDGECVEQGQFFSCYCDHDLCNNINDHQMKI